VSTGGHNPLEATALGVPVVSGKYMFNFDDIVNQLTKEGLMTICENEEMLKESIRNRLIVDTSIQQKAEFKSKAKKFMQQHRGVTARLDHLVSKLL